MIVTTDITGDNGFEKWWRRVTDGRLRAKAEEVGRKSIQAFSEATPVDTGRTANSWEADVTQDANGVSITVANTNIQDGYFNVAVGLDTGHGTGTGGYVPPRPYIKQTESKVLNQLGLAVEEAVK